MSIPFKTNTVRDSAEVEYLCYADDALFGDWDDLSPEAKQEFEDHGPIPCEGGGVAGSWCRRCRFCEILE